MKKDFLIRSFPKGEVTEERLTFRKSTSALGLILGLTIRCLLPCKFTRDLLILMLVGFSLGFLKVRLTLLECSGEVKILQSACFCRLL